MSNNGRPWMKFYPADWRSDPGLRACSLASRGVWIDLISLMHEAEPYGFLLLNGRPLTQKQVAGMLGVRESEVSKAMQELEENFVLSISDEGIVYSRRMVRDEAKRLKDQENGKTGGNPHLNQGVNPPLNGGDKARVRVRGKSTELELEERKPPISPTRSRSLSVIVEPDGFDDFWAAYPRKIGKGQARKAWRAALDKVSAGTIVKACEGYQWTGSTKYTPHPATWLTGERWADERPVEIDFMEGMT
jgi:hypothetical protein